jgi:hypothetical protein
VCGPQQSAQRAAKALVVVDYRDINVLAVHRILWQHTRGYGLNYLPFGEGDTAL